MANKFEDRCLGVVVRRRRHNLHLTQEQLGERIAVSYQQIQKYETGANRIAFSTMIGLADALECEVFDLVTEALFEIRNRCS